MKKSWLPVLIFCVLTACGKHAAKKPVCTNSSGSFSFPNDTLFFTAEGKNWHAVLHSFTQPVPMQVQYTRNGFTITAQQPYGITEGPAALIISRGKQQFYYSLYLRNNNTGAVSEKDYRSPKTVNPDSALLQQRMVHQIDEWRNLMPLQNREEYFFEENVRVPPVTGAYRAQPEKAISAYYVQPGSAVSVNVKAVYKKTENVFEVTAGPLKDKYNNTVANGTMVTFLYGNGEQSFRTETALLNGYATVFIPAEKNTTYRLTARVNETNSPTIQLVP